MPKDLIFEDALVSSAQGARGARPVALARGTLVDTGQGRRPVESLRPGDMVETLDNGLQPLRWISPRNIEATGDDAPVRIAEGVLGNDRDLVLAPGTRVVLSGWQMELHFGEPEVLAEAGMLVNGRTVHHVADGAFEVFQLLFDRPEIVFAEGQTVECAAPRSAGTPAAADPLGAALYPELAADGDMPRLALLPHEALVAAEELGLARPALPSPTAPVAVADAA